MRFQVRLLPRPAGLLLVQSYGSERPAGPAVGKLWVGLWKRLSPVMVVLQMLLFLVVNAWAGAGEDEGGNQRIKRADRNGQSASGEHRDDRGTQGARSGGEDPWVHGD